MLKYSDLTIDGVTRTVAYDFNEICKAEELTGVNLLEGLTQLHRLTAAQLRGLLLAALEAGVEPAFPGESPECSLELAGELIRLDTIGPITEALGEAYMLAVSPDYIARVQAAQMQELSVTPEVTEVGA